ncbi:neuroguidin [Parasteatoda tepidariorum]|uniref:neuroguidin n=1 Tax=Parasteatoda tepidariorum TaxID=114398 RepID=UPI00077F89DC|nr:neuroguidin isoform X2 [Parasteatoda tepidariorum]XP_015930405.1 neuroguidin isoform X2 [Parasteatoda tepidariorum]
MEELSQEDVNETLKLLKDIPALAASVTDTTQNLLKRLKGNELQTKNGLSFYDLKNHTLLNYITDLTYVILQKTSGKSIENDPAVARLCESRIVLEKMRPIEEKLKYQVDKLLTVASTGHINAKDPLRFKANPESLDDQVENEDSEEEQKFSNVYVPPKISAAYFSEDNNVEERKKKILEKSQKRALSSSVLYELRKEYDTGPEEIKETVDPYRIKLNEEMKERSRYEEEYMLRLPMTKKQRHEARQMMTVTNFNPKFDDISALDMQPEDITMKRKSQGKKGKASKNSKKWKGKKRKH